MNGCSQCSLCTTALMLLHAIVFLWSHLSVLMMGRSQEHSTVLNTFLRNHTTFMMKWLMHPPVLVQHQVFTLVKLKDSTSKVLGNAYHSLSPMVPIHLENTFAQTPDLHSHTALKLSGPISCLQATTMQSSIWGDIISMMSLLMTTALQMKILVWPLMSLILISMISTTT